MCICLCALSESAVIGFITYFYATIYFASRRCRMHSTTDIRPSPIAGQWYAGDPRRLAESVDRYLQAAQLPELVGEVVAVMAPHAGHRYSGPVAGYAFAALRGLQPELVVVVSPMHYPYLPALLTSAHSAYETPLGVVPVDTQALHVLDDNLEQALGLRLAPVRSDPEHSLEIELPFLQRALAGEFCLLPVMVRDQSERITHALGLALAKTLRGRRALLVASTDLSHFYPQAVAETLDAELLRCVAAFDPQGVLDAEEQGKGFACGRGALAAVLWAAKALGADMVKVLNHATSGDVTGDYTQVVGYGAAAILRTTK
jgi:AmmeMemoRadiSam system protein B